MAPIARIFSSIFCCAGTFLVIAQPQAPSSPPQKKKIRPSPRRFYISQLRGKKRELELRLTGEM